MKPNTFLTFGWEPWSSGHGRRLMFKRSWVWILAPYTGWTWHFSHWFADKTLLFVWKDQKTEKEAGLAHLKKTFLTIGSWDIDISKEFIGLFFLQRYLYSCKKPGVDTKRLFLANVWCFWVRWTRNPWNSGNIPFLSNRAVNCHTNGYLSSFKVLWLFIVLLTLFVNEYLLWTWER